MNSHIYDSVLIILIRGLISLISGLLFTNTKTVTPTNPIAMLRCFVQREKNVTEEEEQEEEQQQQQYS